MIESRYTAVQETFAAISTHTQESFSGIRVIKGFAREEERAGAVLHGVRRLC